MGGLERGSSDDWLEGWGHVARAGVVFLSLLLGGISSLYAGWSRSPATPAWRESYTVHRLE